MDFGLPWEIIRRVAWPIVNNAPLLELEALWGKEKFSAVELSQGD